MSNLTAISPILSMIFLTSASSCDYETETSDAYVKEVDQWHQKRRDLKRIAGTCLTPGTGCISA